MNITHNKSKTKSNAVAKSKTDSKSVTATETSKVDSTNEKISISRESNRQSGGERRFDNFVDNFKNGFSDVTHGRKSQDNNKLGQLKGAQLKEQLGKLPPEQRESKMLESLDGVKGPELESRLAEIEKVDKELADKLREKLGLKKTDEEKPEEKPEEAAAHGPEAPAEAHKAEGHDDGAPSETFLWKPKSESDGNLVILLPSSESARSVTISGPNVNQTVNKGGRNGSRANGQREHFRFGQPGASMQGPVQVTVVGGNGQTKTMNIANPSQRNEGGQLQDGGGQQMA